MEIFVIINAACGIGAFLIARGAIRKLKRELGFEDPDASKNLDDKEEQ